jgi:NADH-quinone oxidoreductase subunit H
MQSAWLQRTISRVGTQLQAIRGRAPLATKLASALGAVAREVFPEPGPPAALDALVCALLALLPFGQYLLAARLDVALLLVAAAALASSSAFVASGSGWRGVRAALQVLWQHVPAAAAVASVVVTTGSLRVQEIARAQGGWPWDWLAFRSPAALVALALLLACSPATADVRPEPPGSLRSLLEGQALPAARGPWLSAAARGHALLVAGLASVLFLGGWSLPGLSAAEQDARPVLELAGALLLLAKTWGLAVLGAWVRWACPPARLAERTRATALWLSPLAVAAFAATALWTWWGPARTVQLLVSHALVAAVALAVVAVAARIRHGLLAATADGRLSPFL